MPLNRFVEPLLPESSLGVIVVFAIIISFFEAIGQSSMKYYAMDRDNRSQMFIILGVVGYIFVALLLLTSYRNQDMGHMNMVWSCVSIIIAFGLGYLCFAEKVDIYTISSIVLAMAAIYVGHLTSEDDEEGCESVIPCVWCE